MATDRELLQMALDALELTGVEYLTQKEIDHLDALEIALRARLAQPEQEPVRLQCVICGTVYADGVPPQVAQPEQEPVAWISYNAGLYHGKPDESLNPLPLYTTTPQHEVYCGCGDEIVAGDGARCGTCVAVKYKERVWVGLTEKEIIRLRHLYDPTAHWSLDMFARAIEAKLKEKNAND